MSETLVLDPESGEDIQISRRDQYSISLDIFLEETERLFRDGVSELVAERKMPVLSVDVVKDGKSVREKRPLLSFPGRMDDGGVLVLDTQGLLFSAQRSLRSGALNGDNFRGLRSHEIIFHADSVLTQIEIQKQRQPLE